MTVQVAQGPRARSKSTRPTSAAPYPARVAVEALGKAIVAIAVEALGVGERSQRVASGRARLARISDCSELSLTAFCEEAIEPSTVAYTGHRSGYNGLGDAGFIHHPTNSSASGDPAHVVMPRVHRVAPLLERWLLGTHQSGSARASSTSTSANSSSASTAATPAAAAALPPPPADGPSQPGARP